MGLKKKKERERDRNSESPRIPLQPSESPFPAQKEKIYLLQYACPQGTWPVSTPRCVHMQNLSQMSLIAL